MFVRRLALLAIGLIAVLAAAVLAFGNPDPITLDIGLVRFEGVSLALVLVLTFATGVLFGSLLAALTLLGHFLQRRSLHRELGRVEAELDRLRSLPPPDAD